MSYFAAALVAGAFLGAFAGGVLVLLEELLPQPETRATETIKAETYGMAFISANYAGFPQMKTDFSVRLKALPPGLSVITSRP